jgi:2-dehydro-3-deoxyphosphogluconate aldolase / (4S)-4-hydroxy-2-oxoglutarate aldolase
MHAIFRTVSVIPVVTIEREPDAVPLARALLEGGLLVIEVTWRTPAAAAAIAAIAQALPQVAVGADTLQRAADVAAAVHAGARFLVSPGVTGELAASALATELPYLPGVATPSEVMTARALGICVMKWFPAEALGGVAFLKALAPVFPGIAFCPTGGIDEGRAADYLALANVAMVGGSWMAPREAVAAGDWPRIRLLAERAAALPGGRAAAA